VLAFSILDSNALKLSEVNPGSPLMKWNHDLNTLGAGYVHLFRHIVISTR